MKRNLISSKLKMYRICSNLSQEKFTAQLNLLGLDIDRSSLSRIENDQREVYDYELVYFAKALNVGILDLLPTNIDDVKNND